MSSDKSSVAGRSDIAQAYRDEELVKDYVDSRYAQGFGRETHLQQASAVSRIVERVRPERLLELACGPARLTVEIPRVPKAVAVDQSPQMLAEARRRLDERGLDHWELREADAFALPFDDESFDMLATFKLIRHFDKPDRMRIYAEVARVLAPGGTFVVDVFNEQMTRWLLEKWGVVDAWIDDFGFDEAGFAAEAREAGFEVVEMFPIQSALKLRHHVVEPVRRLSLIHI